jgi:hypothetical protein
VRGVRGGQGSAIAMISQEGGSVRNGTRRTGAAPAAEGGAGPLDRRGRGREGVGCRWIGASVAIMGVSGGGPESRLGSASRGNG